MAHLPVAKVRLHVRCDNLLNMDTLSKSDPFCVLYMHSDSARGAAGNWVELGRTEVIMNNLSPHWQRSFALDYYFESVQWLRFDVYDSDNGSDSSRLDLRNKDHVDVQGSMTCQLADIMGSRGLQLQRRIRDGHHGTITVTAEEIASDRATCNAKFSVSCQQLINSHWFSKPDPAIKLARTLPDGSIKTLSQLPVLRSTVVPSWAAMEIKSEDAANNDLQQPFRLEVWDFNGTPGLIGYIQMTFNELIAIQARGGSSGMLPLCHRAGKAKNVGSIMLSGVKVVTFHSFIEYLAGGLEINLACAIDFTASNGPQNVPNSLHFLSPHPNQYQRALQSIGSILELYDPRREFLAFGYGAQLPPQWAVSHAFALNGNNANPKVFGVAGLLAAYSQAIQSVKLHGPTNFAPIINIVAQQCHANTAVNPFLYTVLLIVTDGEITDMDLTTKAIVDASILPLSIIIVGVGNNDFDRMNILDGDDVRLSHSGRFAARDIVQFVPFARFASSPALLAQETLAEIPRQVQEYFASRGIHPRPPLQLAASGFPSDPAALAYQQSLPQASAPPL